MEVGLVKGGYEETFVRKRYPNAAIKRFANMLGSYFQKSATST